MKVFIRFYAWFVPVVLIASAVSYGAMSDLSEDNINSIKAIVGDEIIRSEEHTSELQSR